MNKQEDLISRQAAIDAIEEYSDRLQMVNWKENSGVPYKVHALNWCVNTIRELPSAQPERKNGRWIMHIDDLFPEESTMECNQCHEHQPITIDDNYCPNCGAEMVKGEEDETD